MDFNYGPKLREVELTPREKEVRLNHCINIRDNHGLNFGRILFSDESYFKSNYVSQTCWQKEGTRVPRGERQSDKYGYVMVFGAISKEGKSKLWI